MFDDIVLPLVRQLLIDQLSFRDSEVITHDSERVPSKYGGKRHINVYPESISFGPSPDQHVGQEWVSSFNIGVTLRTGKFPNERMFSVGYAPDLLQAIRLILIAMRRERYTLTDQINALLEHPWKLVEPYRVSSSTLQVIRVGPDHFNAEETSDVRQYYGLFIKASYGEARFMANVHPGQQDFIRPNAEFTATPENATKTATLLNTSTGTGPLTYAWDFGDGIGTSTLRDPPPYTYAFDGSTATFTITLVVTGPDGTTDTAQRTVTFTTVGPIDNLDLVTMTIPDLDDLDIDPELDNLEVEDTS